jgi:hypothetical protein
MYNMAPRYKRIEILLNKNNNEKSDWYQSIKDKKEEKENKLKTITDPLFQNREKQVFEDAALVVTGGYILITQEYGGDEVGSERSVVGRIFNLSDVFSYKAYFEQR